MKNLDKGQPPTIPLLRDFIRPSLGMGNRRTENRCQVTDTKADMFCFPLPQGESAIASSNPACGIVAGTHATCGLATTMPLAIWQQSAHNVSTKVVANN